MCICRAYTSSVDIVHTGNLVVWCLLCVSFSQITQEQVTTFQAEAGKFNEKFKTEGPASVGADLDKGEGKCLP